MGLCSRSESCCCCIGVKAGTLILLYLDLFAIIGAMIAIINGNDKEVIYFNGQSSYTTHRNQMGPPFILGCLVLLIIVFAGLFAIGKKKPSLLIPYFIVKSVIAIAVILILAPILFLEKKGLDVLDTPKSYNRVYSDGDNIFGTSLNYASNGIYALIIVEILLIILVIHLAKVVYACYKRIEEELVANQGNMYASLIPPCAPPYIPLQPQLINQVPSTEPVYVC